jgi:serine/threonine protein kinase
MALGSMEEFLAVLEHSKLLKPEEFAAVQRLAKEAADPAELAKNLVRKGTLTRWQAGQLLAGRSKCTVGKYKLLELLGRGGMGSVYLGEHVMMNRRVALKIIPRHIGKDPAGLERFLAEARIIASLDHPNVVQAYSVDNEGDQYYLVMEYVEGLDLARLVEAEGPLDCASAVDYIRQAADGLAHAHARNMVHCDIKPSNLIVNPQGVVKILDMGLARLMSQEKLGGNASEIDERILGSVDYMSPEQALHTADFNHRADIYSLGCTLYFLLTGHAPFPEGTLPERILKHQTQEPQSISSQRSDVPQSLIEICQKMMSKRPSARYQTADELSQVLAAWRPGEKRVQRVLQLKKAEPADELPSPDLLGADLSELFRKGMGMSATTPLVTRKPPSRADNLPPALRPFFSTPQRTVLTACISAAVVILLAVAVIMFAGKNPPTVVEGPREVSNTTENPGDNGPQAKKPDTEEREPNKGPKTGEETPPEAPPEPPKPPVEVPKPEGPAEKPETQIQAPKPEPTPPDVPSPEPPPAEPFKELATSVDLPEIPKTESRENPSGNKAVLGKILLSPGKTLQLVLLGGEKPVKGADFLIMKAVPKTQFWQVYVETASQDKGDPQHIEIAQFRLSAGNLLFNWMPGATPALAEALKNCGIIAFAEGQRQFVQLCRPRQVEPLVIDLDNGGAKTSLPLGSANVSGNLRVQITDRDENFPSNALDPSDTMEVKTESENEIMLVFSDPRFEDFKIRITTEIIGQKLELRAAGIYQVPQLQGNKILDPQWKIFKPEEALTLQNALKKKQLNLQDQYDKLKEGAAAKKTVGKTLDMVKKTVDFLEELKSLYLALNNKGKINYRVFILYGKNNKVELFNTQVPVVEPVEVKEADQNNPSQNQDQQPPKKPKKSGAKKKTQ